MGQQTIAGQFPTGVGPAYSQSLQSEAVTFADSGAYGGTLAWNVAGLPNRVTAPVNTSGETHGLIAENFGFTIPAAATIEGVIATVTRSGGFAVDGSTFADALIGLLPGGAFAGFNRGAVGAWPYTSAGNLPAAYGSPTDLWGVALTPAIINAANFGVVVQATFNNPSNKDTPNGFVQSVALQVYYTIPGIPGVILADASANGFASSQWTQGGVALYQIPAQPGLTTPWKIVGYSISFQGLIYTPTPSLPTYGLMGSIWGGLLFDTSVPPNQGGNPWMNPMPQFPANSGLVNKLWDGETDTPFPLIDPAVAMPPARFLTFTESLDVPVTMQSGEGVVFGLWLAPGLVQNLQILLANATYSLIYDDSQT
jgi:hypothetical protein